MSTFFAPPGHNQQHIVVFDYDPDRISAICRCGWHKSMTHLPNKTDQYVKSGLIVKKVSEHFSDEEHERTRSFTA